MQLCIGPSSLPSTNTSGNHRSAAMKIRHSDYRIYPARLHHISEVPTYYAMANHLSRLPGASWLLVVYILLTFCANALEARVVSSRSTVDSANRRSPATSGTQRDPYDELANIIGIRRVPLHLRHHSPPDYLRHLYHSTTDAKGIVRSPPPHHADTIYGYLNTRRSGQTGSSGNFFYNVTRLEQGSQLLNADFHVFRMHRRRPIRVRRSSSPTRQTSTIFLTLKLYKIVDAMRRSTPFGNKLIDVKRVPRNYYGWIVFNAQQAVKEWTKAGATPNHGFLITAQTGDGSFVDVGSLSFAQRFHHQDRLQPLLAIYTNHKKKPSRNTDTPSETRLTQAFANRDPNRYQQVYKMNFYVPPPRVRERRDVRSVSDSSSAGAQTGARSAISSPSGGPTGHNGNSRMGSRSRAERHSRANPSQLQEIPHQTQQYCSRQSMFVDFAKVGWDEWIISPRGFDAMMCKGQCPFPLGQTYKPTNHAVVQSIVYAMKVAPNVHSPCCVPHKLKSIAMLYYDEKYRVVLKQYDDMVVSSCGCE